MASSFGTLFRITTFGESHGKSVGVIIDNCPPAIKLTEADIQPQLDRRRPGQSAFSTPRQEADQVQILSGTENGKTLGTPIALIVNNRDHRPKDYGEMANIPRPSHADYTYQMKYDIRASSGGGRSSARETIATVAAGSVADMILREKFSIEIVAWVESIGSIAMEEKINMDKISRTMVDSSVIRCPDATVSLLMQQKIASLQEAGDSTGGVIRCVIRGVPAGIGEPVFDKLEARLAQMMLAIPASKGFEIGSGFLGSTMHGSLHNDPFTQKGERLGTVSNNSGGIQGGISNGESICFRVAFKPPATISLPQKTVDFTGKQTQIVAKGRHDACVVPRAVPIVESMAALVILDALLQQEARKAITK